MQFENKKVLLASGLLMSLTTLNVEASLTPYTSGGQNLVYSSVSDVTWTQDANLFKTLFTTNANLISQIVGSGTTYDDPVYGLQIIDANDFNTGNGQMSWWGAKAFVNYLNNVNYGGSSQWSLPTSNSIDGYNGTAGNELGQLFYSELGGTAGNNIPNSSAFNNEQAYAYWSGTEYEFNPRDAWFLDTSENGGYQGHIRKDDTEGNFRTFYAWAVSPGQVSAVPVPSAVWLFGSGLIGLLGFIRRG